MTVISVLKTQPALATFRPSASLHQQLGQYLNELHQLQSDIPLSALRQNLIRLLYLAMLEPVNPARAYTHIFESSSPLNEADLSTLITRLQWVTQLFHLKPENLGQLYEMLLGFTQSDKAIEPQMTGRKQAGSFFTPYPLAQAMADRLLKHLLQENSRTPLEQALVLDPAFGGGIFLQALSKSLKLSQLYGVDQDPGAVETTRLMLWHAAGQPDRLSTFFMGENLIQGDALGKDESPKRLFEAIIGNPPYLSVKQGLSTERRKYYESRYRCATGQYDIYSLFLERSLELLSPGGVLAFLLPKPLLVNDQQRPVRELLLENRLLEIWDIGRDAFSPQAAVESTVILLQKAPAPSGHTFVRMDWRENTPVESGHIEQQALGDFGEKTFNLWLVPENVAFLKAVERAGAPLSEWIVAPSGRGMEMGKNQCHRQPGPGLRPVLTGQEVTAFHLPKKASFYAAFDPNDAKKHKPLALYHVPKLIIRRVANRPTAALDEGYPAGKSSATGHWLTLNTLYNFHLSDPSLMKAVCALINSEILHRWFIHRFYFTETLFPYLRQQQLLMLPLPSLERMHTPLPSPLKTGLLSQEESVLSALNHLHDHLKSIPAASHQETNAQTTRDQLDQVIRHLYQG